MRGAKRTNLPSVFPGPFLGKIKPIKYLVLLMIQHMASEHLMLGGFADLIEAVTNRSRNAT